MARETRFPVHPSIHPTVTIEKRKERERGSPLRPPPPRLLPWRKHGRFQKATSSRDEQDMRGHPHATTCRDRERLLAKLGGRKKTPSYHNASRRE